VKGFTGAGRRIEVRGRRDIYVTFYIKKQERRFKDMHSRKRVMIFVLALAALALALASPVTSAAEGKKGHGEEKGHGVNWGYEGEAGPAHWGGLSTDYAVCGEGKRQSPVDVKGATGAELKELGIHYYVHHELPIVNNGHTVQVNTEAGQLSVDGEKYKLLQFHFHAPSEHTVDGKSHAMEMHLVHKNDKGALAVIGVFIDEGAHNKAYERIWAHLPAHAGDSERARAIFNPAELLPANTKSYTTYPGSLTTPPCSEIVTWLVLNEPVQMSAEQIDAFRKIVDNNNRPVQPLNDRTLRTRD